MIYGPDNGWYYRVTGSRVERAFPSTGRTWEEVVPGTSAYTAIQAMVKSLSKRGKTLTEKAWKKVAKKAAKDSRLTSSTPAFQPSFYSPPSVTSRRHPGSGAAATEAGPATSLLWSGSVLPVLEHSL